MKKMIVMLMSFCALFFLSSCAISLPSSDVQGIPGEIYSSIIIVILAVIFFFIVFLCAKRADPLKKPHGLLLVMEMLVEYIDHMVEDNMGKRYLKIFGPYIMCLGIYIFSCFLIGLLGLPSPMTYYMVPFSIALISFVMIHVTSMHFKKWKYFKRYIDPIPVFLPINLLSMWAPLLSMSFRLLGNALAGWVLMEIVYTSLESLSTALFGLPYFIAPLITPVLHAYFDIFSGFIQTTVFVMLTMLFVAQEGPLDDDEELEKLAAVSK